MGQRPRGPVGPGFLLNGATAPESSHRHKIVKVINNESVNEICINSLDKSGNLTGSASARPFIRLKVCDKEGSWLYDTGASVTCMSLKEFRKIHPDCRPQKIESEIRLVTASKTPMTVMGTYLLPFNIFGKTFKHPVHVCTPMNQAGIIGMDIISKLGLTYLSKRKSFIFESHLATENVTVFSGTAGRQAALATDRKVVIPPHTQKVVQIQTVSANAAAPLAGVTAVANVLNHDFPALWGGPAVIATNFKCKTFLPLTNCGSTPMVLPRGTVVGQMETVNPASLQLLNQEKFLETVQAMSTTLPPPPSPQRVKEIMADLTLTVPEQYKQQYIDLILANHDVFSKTKNDLGRANNFTHKIDLKDKSPVYIPQYRLADTHKDKLEQQVDEWLQMGIIQPSNSKYNSPIFVVPKKNGENRYVLDYRALNAHSHDDRYTMRTVDECIAEIGKSKSTIFSTLDLSSGYHQMLLDKNSRHLTAFTIPGKGQFEWLTTSMGLRGAVSSFQRMVELAMKGIDNLVVYIDDLLAHAATHEQQLQILKLVFDRLRKTGLKANLKKCHFGSTNVAYLGFQLTPEGVKPGRDKLGAVRGALPPTDVHQVRQFLGLVNFFRAHVRNFSMISSPLTQLTRKDSPWRGGQLPPDALKAFNELKQILCSEPVIAYPRADRPYSLIVDAAAGITKVNSKGERTFRQEGGLGAILCQADEKGEQHVIAYASRALSEHEKNYTPFLLEMLACCWGVDHFDVHLRGRKFVIYSDHKPLEKLSCVHKKTLNRLQDKMNEFDFVIHYKKGSEMPADFLSRNVLEEIDIFTPDLPMLQQRDEFAHAVTKFLQNGELPANNRHAAYVRRIAPSCFIEDSILWRRVHRFNTPPRTVLVVPATLVDNLVHETHTSQLAGHEGVTKTKERLLQSYFWPNMDADISRHTTACQRCQARRRDIKPIHNLLSPLPQCTEMNQRVHMDLFGPLKTSAQGKKFVLCITDAFTKYAEMLAIENKEAVTVGKAVFERWICKFGTPLEIVTDNGREFCNALSKELYKLLQIKHSTTTPYWPQCNSQAEVANKTIQKYLASFVNESTLDWPLYMAPMAFAYNTSLHRSIKSTPFFLTYGTQPRYPSFPNPEVQRYYGESQAAEWYQTLQQCRQLAAQHNMDATTKAEQDYNKSARPHHFQPGQAVWLNEQNYLGRNRKLAPHWNGPYTIIRVFDQGVVELQLPNRKLRVNVGRIKPYVTPISLHERVVALPGDNSQPFDATLTQAPPCPPTQPPPQAQAHHSPAMQPLATPPPPAPLPPPPADENDMHFWDNDRAWPVALPHPPAPGPAPPRTPPPQPPTAPEPPPAGHTPQPRPRGRPRKLQQPPPPPNAPDVTPQQPERMITRAMARAQARAQMTPEDAITLQRKVASAARHLRNQKQKYDILYHTGGANGPKPVVDEYNLPVPAPGSTSSKQIRRRRQFLKSLTPQTRNLLLTGDPVFAFDPLDYEIILQTPARHRPPILHDQFDYLPPELNDPQDPDPPPPPPPWHPEPNNPQPPPLPPPPPQLPNPDPPIRTPPPGPARPPPGAPRRRRSLNDATDTLFPSPGGRSGSFSGETSSSASPPLQQLREGWYNLRKRTAAVSKELTQVPPPGWKPRQRQPPKQPSAAGRLAAAIKKELTQPPPPWFEQDQPASTKPPSKRGGGGARPKQK